MATAEPALAAPITTWTLIKKALRAVVIAIAVLAWAYTSGGVLGMAAVTAATAALTTAYIYRRNRAANTRALTTEAPAAAAELVVAYALGARELGATVRRGTLITTITAPSEYSAADANYLRGVALLARDVHAHRTGRGGDLDASRAADLIFGRLIRDGQAPTGRTLPDNGAIVDALRDLRRDGLDFARSVLDEAAPIHDSLTTQLREHGTVTGADLDRISHQNPLEDAPTIGTRRHA